MTEKLQWEIEAHIRAPVAKVWNAIEDLSLIPKYHPVVRSIECVSGQTRRAPGATYKCVVPDGRQLGWCVERVIENVPNQRMSVSFPEDSWGVSNMFEDFIVETTLESAADGTTRVRLAAFYLPKRLTVRVMNALVIRRMMRKRARQTIHGFKRLVEELA
jgi:uncharacterized protein YndB with AHSA1/START domain